MHNEGNYIASLGNLTRWLAEKAEALGVEIFPGFAAAEVLYHEDGHIKGVATGDMGRDVDGNPKDSFEPGMELHAKVTVFAEGCRGHLGKELIARFKLDDGKSPQHYGIGLKELWQVDPDKHEPGVVVHGAGWPLSETGSTGGAFLYHLEDNQVVVGLIIDLNYDNPHLSTFDEFQRFKTHPEIARVLEGGERICYGARGIVKGGLNSLPKMSMPGALIIGCDAGTLNFAKIKGTHTAMKSGSVAAETIAAALANGDAERELSEYQEAFMQSWAGEELSRSRNWGPALHKFGMYLGGAYNYIDQNFFKGRLPFAFRDDTPDHATLKRADACRPVDYPKPDGKLTFDKPSSVFLSNTNHEEGQPVHLKLSDPSIPITVNLPAYAEPAQRYCPVGVYEVVEDKGEPEFVINAQNCIHCKTCDIKDPAQNRRLGRHLGHSQRLPGPHLGRFSGQLLDPEHPHCGCDLVAVGYHRAHLGLGRLVAGQALGVVEHYPDPVDHHQQHHDAAHCDRYSGDDACHRPVAHLATGCCLRESGC